MEDSLVLVVLLTESLCSRSSSIHRFINRLVQFAARLEPLNPGKRFKRMLYNFIQSCPIHEDLLQTYTPERQFIKLPSVWDSS
jgi:hypothetical protein